MDFFPQAGAVLEMKWPKRRERRVVNSRPLRLLNAEFVLSGLLPQPPSDMRVVCCPAHGGDDGQKAPQLSSVWPERAMCVRVCVNVLRCRSINCPTPAKGKEV